MSISKQLDLLRQEQNESPPPSLSDGCLKLSELTFEEAVFQPRVSTPDWQSQNHIKRLRQAIQRNESNRLERVKILWTGIRWVVLDGHHRVLAYQSEYEGKSIDPPIPVEVFSGSLEDALLECSADNHRDRLNMSLADKLERAWELVKLSLYQVLPVCEATGVSQRTVKRMRAALKSHDMHGFTEAEILTVDWNTISGRTTSSNHDPGERDKVSKYMTLQIRKALGPKAEMYPDLVIQSILNAYPKSADQMLDAMSEYFPGPLRLVSDNEFDDF